MSNFNISFSPGPRVHTTNLHTNSSFMVHPPHSEMRVLQLPRGGGLRATQIDVDKFRSPPSYQNFPSIFTMLCAILCTPDTGSREGFLCATPFLRCPRPCSLNA